METKQELVTFVIPFDEVYGEVYGIPTINDLDINGYGVYDTSKWPSEIKEFVTAFASDDDVISIPGYAAWDRYNLDRAKEFVNIYQRLLGKYIDFVEVKFDKFDYGTLFATVDRFDLIKEFADKYEIAQDETDPAKIVEAVCDFILDKENLNYDDIAKEAENTRTVKSNYTLSLQALKDEFEFEPELTSINDLCNYAKVGDKFVWVADAPGQQKLQFEKKENKMQIDKEVLAVLNEGGGAGVSFSFDIQSSMIDGYTVDATETDTTFEFNADETTLESYEDSATLANGGIFKIEKEPVLTKLKEIIDRNKYLRNTWTVVDEPYTGKIDYEFQGISGDINFVYSAGWIRKELTEEGIKLPNKVYVEFKLSGEVDGNYARVDVNWKNSPDKDLFADSHDDDIAHTDIVMVPADIIFYPSEHCVYAYNQLDELDDGSESLKEKVKEITKAEWDKLPDDYKSIINGKKYMLYLDNDSHATVLGPCKIVDESLYDATLAKVKTLTKARDLIYEVVDTKGVYDDDHWEKVAKIINQIRDLGADVTYWPANDSRHSAGYSNDPSIPEKVYLMRIKFKNADDKEFVIDGSITCSGCGTVSDPLSKYDCTMILFTELLDIDESDDKFNYMLLDRLRQDCEYFLGNGNGYEGHLWAGNIEDQIAKMKELYNKVPEKPEWISLDDIDKYEKEMLAKRDSKNESKDEAISTDTLDSLIKDALKDSTDYLLSETYGDFSYINELAESVGYKTYGGSEYKSTALVMNVKGMPDLDLDALGLAYDVDAGDKIQLAINDFADQLEEEFEDFTIRGRSGGYWGLANFEKNITISEDGYIGLIDAVKVLLNDPTLKYKESFDEANDENNIEEIKDIISECIYYDSNELVNNLNSDPNYIEVKPEYLAKMNELRDLIKAQEKAMQSKDFWEVYESKNENMQDVANTYGIDYSEFNKNHKWNSYDEIPPEWEEFIITSNIRFQDAKKYINENYGWLIEIVGDEIQSAYINYKIHNSNINSTKSKTTSVMFISRAELVESNYIEIANKIIKEAYDRYPQVFTENKKSDSDKWIDAYYTGHKW